MMFKPLIRITLAHLIWRHYKPVLVATAVCIVGLVLVSMLHADYVAFAKQLQGESYLGLSFIAKWLLYILIVGIWIYIWIRTLRQQQRVQNIRQLMASEEDTTTNESDPFYHIRHKDKLKSKADVILNKHQS